ncbi:4'-phosphopantetheinyl transferase superfamily protein [Chitinophaga ginsengisoli]|uniref:4'-phosphopantetheinyl transferase superfamily protein n=1 Tax=Chitinophaga ginsengisoli TaxID=363837 RepID=A0A2P8GLH5_9BACT|nr:4'-phosphopantetheinyl transferase superfamily protein [Chitinophaga ginsengisoli]PSL34827.1 4'-phosphopantetheinyl transferase superfamily protein [Chitinophaga ginsengisoli]
MMLIHQGKFTLKRENSMHAAAFCILHASLRQLTQHIHLLHPEERSYYETLKFDKRRESYLLGRISAKKAIGALSVFEDLGKIAIEAGIFQFPVVKYAVTRNLQVSITHCEGLGIALSYPEVHPLGLDLERTDKANTEAIKEQLTPGELALMKTVPLPEDIACTMVWTMKEALSKVLRTGLTMDLKLLEIQSLVKEGDLYTSHFKHLIQYRAISCYAGTHVCSIVVPGKTTPDLEEFWGYFRETVLGSGE